MRRLPALLLAIVAAVFLVVGGWAGPAAAHNSLGASDPVDGAVLTAPPTQLALTFANAVPLETFSAQLVDASNAVIELKGAIAGPTDKVVVQPLNRPTGAFTVRWKLVSSDGHVVSGRVSLTAPVSAAVDPAQGLGATTSSTPAVSTPVTSVSSPTPNAPTGDKSSPLGSVFRWVLRVLSYLAVLVVAGVAAATVLVWGPASENPMVQRAVRLALAALAVLTVLQFVVLLGDLDGAGVSGALKTGAGRALGFRLLLTVILAAVLFFSGAPVRFVAANVLLIPLLGTWAWAGHAKSQRWSLIGVPLDIAHHGGVAVWLGSLAVVGLVAIRSDDSATIVASVQRLSRIAPIAVGVIVATGVLQTIRLDRGPSGVLGGTHGRLLILKLVFVAFMLWVANVNRQRVARRFRSSTLLRPGSTAQLGRAMVSELAAGLIAIGVTAAMVVSPPASAEAETFRTAGSTTSSSTPQVASPSTSLPSTTQGPTTVLPGTTVTSISTTTTAAATAACTISGPVQTGSTGPNVECVQKALIALKVLASTADGVFGNDTDRAVKAYQTSKGLLADGIVGPATAAALGIQIALPG